MIVTVKEYLEDTHELSCDIDDRDKIFGNIIIVDPFVLCAIETTDDNFREVGRSMVGKVYEMTEFGINDDHVYCPNKFEHIPSFPAPVITSAKTTEEISDYILLNIDKSVAPKHFLMHLLQCIDSDLKEAK